MNPLQKKKIVALTAIAACVLTMSSPVIAKADDVEVCAMGCLNNDHTTLKEVYNGTSEVMVDLHGYWFDDGVINGNESWIPCMILETRAYYTVTCFCGRYTVGEIYEVLSSRHSSNGACGQ